MAKDMYVGVNGKARKVKAVYVGVNGKARKVTAGYVGVGGKARAFYNSVDKGFDYTGKWEKWTEFLRNGVDINGKHATIYGLTTSGTLTLRRNASVWLIGGGGSGMSGCVPSQTSNTNFKGNGYNLPGNGGGSGYIAEGTLSAGSYPVKIGQGGKGSKLKHELNAKAPDPSENKESYLITTSYGSYYAVYWNWGNDGGDTTIGPYTAKGGKCKGDGGSGGGGAAISNVYGKGSGKKFAPFGQTNLYTLGNIYYCGGGGGAGWGNKSLFGNSDTGYVGGGAGWNGNNGILGTDTSGEDLYNYTHSGSGQYQQYAQRYEGGYGGYNYDRGGGGYVESGDNYDASVGYKGYTYGCGGGGGAGSYNAESQAGGDGYQGLVLIAVMDE